MPDDVILAVLKQELNSAIQRHQAAKENFWKVSVRPRQLSRYTAGVPEPEGAQMMRNAIREETNARQGHIAALVRLNEYLLHRTVPEDLKNKPKLTTAARP